MVTTSTDAAGEPKAGGRTSIERDDSKRYLLKWIFWFNRAVDNQMDSVKEIEARRSRSE